MAAAHLRNTAEHWGTLGNNHAFRDTNKTGSCCYQLHLATNFQRRIKRFIRLALGQIAYFTQLPAAGVTSWVNLLYRAATEDSDIAQLLPMYTSLVPPEDDDLLDFLDYLVVTAQALMGPLPVTQQNWKRTPESFLSWMHLRLTIFQAAQDTPYAPKLFTLMPQTGHHTAFIKISTTSLHKFLKAAGEDVPALTKKIAKEEFTDRPDYWWSRYTRCLSFSRRPPAPPPPWRRHTFHTSSMRSRQTESVSVCSCSTLHHLHLQRHHLHLHKDHLHLHRDHLHLHRHKQCHLPMAKSVSGSGSRQAQNG